MDISAADRRAATARPPALLRRAPLLAGLLPAGPLPAGPPPAGPLLAGLLLAGSLLAGSLLAGCGHPTPPSVTLDPIDVSHYAADPCTLLTPDRAQRRHLAPKGTVVSGTEPGCRWSSTRPVFPSITAGASTGQGLADLDRTAYSYFQTGGMIDGYPAVQTATGPGGPRGGNCTARVGVGPHATVSVTADYPTVTSANAFSADPCADADTMATEIVGALAAGSP